MKRIIYRFFNNYFDFLILSSIVIVILLPAIDIKFSWIDDGWDVNVAKNIVDSFLNFDLIGIINNLLELNTGRVRPVYWMFQTFLYIVGGQISSIYYFFHNILIAGITFLLFKLIYFFTKSKISSYFGSLLFFLIPLNFENWVRLGPQEPYMLILILISLYFYFVKGNKLISLIAIFLSFFTKETAIAIVPAFAIYFLVLFFVKRKLRIDYRYLVVLILLSFVSVLFSMLIKQGYSDYYVFDVSTIVSNFTIYISKIKSILPISILFLLSYVLRNLRPIVNFKFNKIKYINIIELFFLLGFVSFVGVQSPWVWVLDRYLLPALALGSIFIGIETHLILEILKKFKNIYLHIVLVFSIYFIYFVCYSYVNLYSKIVVQRQSTNVIYSIVKKLTQDVPENGIVYINVEYNESTYEPLIELALHTDLFFSRNDIKFDYISNLKSESKGHIILSSSILPLGSYIQVDEFKLATSKNLLKKESYLIENKYLVVSNLPTLLKQFLKKSFNFVDVQEKIDASGIYTDYLLKDTWSLYYY